VSKIVMYTTQWCPYCRNAKALLASKGQKWEEIDVEVEPSRRREMVQRSGRTSVRRSGSASATSADTTISERGVEAARRPPPLRDDVAAGGTSQDRDRRQRARRLHRGHLMRARRARAVVVAGCSSAASSC
jgi:hypothetical protein